MKRIRGVVSTGIALGLCAGFLLTQDVKNFNPGFDFSGIEEFWKIVDILKTDREPTEGQWRTMFDTPGYAELVRREFKPDYFKNAMRAVYQPSQESLAEKLIREDKQKGGFLAWYTPLVIEGFRNAGRDRDWILDQIENEGIGDLINREPLYYDDGCFVETDMAERYHKEQEAQPSFIRIMDAILKEMAAQPSLSGQLGRSLQGFIPQSGHPTGFFMARVILGQFGAETLVEIARNPFQFFFLYNEAARKNGQAPVFSDQAIHFLKMLENKYGIK